jgi:hypothetical protein
VRIHTNQLDVLDPVPVCQSTAQYSSFENTGCALYLQSFRLNGGRQGNTGNVTAIKTAELRIMVSFTPMARADRKINVATAAITISESAMVDRPDRKRNSAAVRIQNVK